ncbi:MAG: Rrf2 family transcriptional regulator [Gammaproteobacteria bacterium]|nr:Rrf2 family transcriptional regulator [Gammaproteobacteria bacterium]
MRLTTFTDYSLRVLIYLGLRDNALATIGDIANAYGISKNHLMKVVQFLGQQGYIETQRGKSGGLRLARVPEQINLGGLVRDTEAQTVLLECFAPEPSECRIEPVCALRGILTRSLQAFYAVLDEYTLADVLHNRTQLTQILGE